MDLSNSLTAFRRAADSFLASPPPGPEPVPPPPPPPPPAPAPPPPLDMAETNFLIAASILSEAVLNAVEFLLVADSRSATAFPKLTTFFAKSDALTSTAAAADLRADVETPGAARVAPAAPPTPFFILPTDTLIAC